MAYALRKSVTTLGRHPHCDVTIAQVYKHVSREHAQIRYENGRYVLYDTSTHGTLINDHRMTRQSLRDGDVISLAGEVEFIYTSGALYNPRRAAGSVGAGNYAPFRVGPVGYGFAPSAKPSSGGKDRTTAALLAFFLGGIGAHRFYLGDTTMGILFLLFSWSGIPALIGLIEGIQFLSMTDEVFHYRFS
jgi:hypothetical protein